MIADRRIYTVTEITRGIKIILEDSFPVVWVEGEISNLRIPTSGHIYFTLKDDKCQLNSVIFKNINNTLKFELHDGLVIICFGRIGVYEKTGQYQLYVEQIEPKGLGALQLAFEQLKEKLRAEGLFDTSRKKRIPLIPERIGIITSPTGAAIRDMLNVLDRRFSNIHILINPVRVQGEGAADEIAKAIDEFNSLGNIDVIIVGRGGGSMEDLWAFNEEIVARAIYKSKIPIISAIGHEIDTTIADFVADLRAPTPSAAAELVVVKKEDIVDKISGLTARLKNLIFNKVVISENRLKALKESRIFKDPLQKIYQYQQNVDELTKNLIARIKHQLEIKSIRFESQLGRLESLSPLSILGRGYSITTKIPAKEIIKDVEMLKKGDRIQTKVWKGSFVSKVEEITTENQ